MLPGLAYHLIWDKWYRNKQVTRTIFEVNPNWAYGPSATGASGYGARKNVSQIHHSFYSDTEFSIQGTAASGNYRTATSVFEDTASLTWPDGVSFSLPASVTMRVTTLLPRCLTLSREPLAVCSSPST